jgi:type I restriction enzyme S subunit
MTAIDDLKGWVTRTLGQICDEVGGIIRTGPFGSQLHQSDYQDEGLPVVMPKDIVDGRISVEGIARIGDEDVERLSQHRLKKGDIVYGRRGDIGRRALITQREAGWLCGMGCLRISLGDSVLDPTFLYYYLGEAKVIGWIYNQAIGATMPNLNTSIIRSIPITYPSLPVQHKIAAILSAYDDLIENNTRRIEILEEMARSLYREWFVNFRFPGHEQVKMVDSELGLIPEGWEVKPIGEIINYKYCWWWNTFYYKAGILG